MEGNEEPQGGLHHDYNVIPIHSNCFLLAFKFRIYAPSLLRLREGEVAREGERGEERGGVRERE